MNELEIVEYNGVRVLTTQQIAEAYGTEERRISENFNANKKRYTEGKHFIKLEGDALKDFLQSVNSVVQNPSKVRNLYLWTEKGAFLHAKSLNTDIAWEVYDNLVDTYFSKKEDLLEGISEELKAIITVDKRVSNVEKKVDHLENTMNIDYAQQKQLRKLVGEVITSALGGKGASAYKYRYEDNSKLSGKCFSRFWNDYYDYFGVNSYANTPRVKYNEALEYINSYRLPTNTQLEIGRINREIA